MKTPIIETERMLLRPLSVMDANDIYMRDGLLMTMYQNMLDGVHIILSKTR